MFMLQLMLTLYPVPTAVIGGEIHLEEAQQLYLWMWKTTC